MSALYNKAKFLLENFLNFENAYFEYRIFEKDISKLITEEKLNQLRDVFKILKKLQEESNFTYETKPMDMIEKKGKDQIDVMYRTALCHQFVALYALCGGKEEIDISKNLTISNEYIKKCFDTYHVRNNKGMRVKKPNYLFKVQALNNYLLDQKQRAYESLERGQSDSFYRLAELYYIEKEFYKAIIQLEKIKQNDRLNMFNKAQKLLERIYYVRKT